MAILLNIETSTAVCSVSISDDTKIEFYREAVEEKSHASSLAVLIDEGMKKLNLTYNQLNAVSVSRGPGSYTGLRIGVSTAKGICYGANIPLISVSTLKTLAYGVIVDLQNNSNTENMLLCPMIDARRMEVYNAIFNINGVQQSDIKADIINKDSYKELLDKHTIYFFGDGAVKCKEIITHTNAKFIDGIYPSAKNMVTIANQKYHNKELEDTAYFEPFYLKDFIATIPKKNIYT